MEYLNHVHSIDYVWRKWNPAKWEIQPKANDICGLWHVGLKNLGASKTTPQSNSQARFPRRRYRHRRRCQPTHSNLRSTSPAKRAT